MQCRPFVFDALHEGDEQVEVFAADRVIGGVLAYCHVADRCFAAESPIEAVEAKRFPRPEIQAEPAFMFGVIRPFGYFDEDRLFRVFISELLQPVALAFLRQTPAEGRAEFFEASSMNSAFTWATC